MSRHSRGASVGRAWLLGAAAAGLLLAGPAARADEEPLSTALEGLFQGQGEGGGRLALTLINLEGDTFAALVTTEVPGRCAGRLAGIGKLDDAEMLVENVEARDDAVCRLTVTFENKGRRARIVSAGQCTYFHGISCSFKGTLNQVAIPTRLKPRR
ncbi:MAG TPA: hypothetical protein VGU45_01290 [Microvirga sp.]|jgi:hypothetical protein|nr:hypothetical protein [Microvirga sp.]